MKTIHVSAKIKIQPGKSEEFKEISRKCVDLVKEKDQGTLAYDWFFSDDETECEVRESYTDSNAMMEHMRNLQDELGGLFALGHDLELVFYGDLSEQVREAIAPFNPKIYGYGFSLNS
ncbi:putative quinol monooxygenase [Fulvivirga sediminis]|uniref:Antibiotic biosynthesis monooxygenase n=1 Tax=Fulvivirga sediminis TaxID=2803949 RepID=A0A937JYD1_9BACT|nr:antibiotic biosynthesis monooxygenase [Fulvivirga sediminis]MBL3655554.1 antibiotic biosynthesis monooxygenase [Fulvivirga sediminis]